jgi:DNA-binding response OmpR family regulator
MCKVLVVDDDSDILRVLEIMLTMKGFDVECLSKGAEVHQTIFDFKPNLVLLDVNLGAHDGRDICREIKSKLETKQMPVILFSANHNISQSAFDAKADDFFEKPFDVEHLVTTLTRFCN